MSPRLEGELACIRGAKLSANPYSPGTQSHAEWAKGHATIASDKREVRA